MSIRRRRHRAAVGGRARRQRASSRRRRTCATRATCGCSPRSRGSTAGPGGVLAGAGPDTTLREFLAAGRFTAYFTRHFMEPLVAAVWSCDPEVALDYPARYLFTFLEHHGMLGVFGSPQWRTVTGGSQRYVAAVAARLQQVRTGVKVTSVLETADGVEVTDGNGVVQHFDAVVIATHPDQALAMLAEPTTDQRDVLTAMPYSHNVALLHTDESVLPSSRHARASWNFRRPTAGPAVVTYDLTRLQRLDTETRYLVTLGGEEHVDPAKVIDRMEYEHPLYNPDVRRRPGAAAGHRHATASASPAPTTAGGSTRTARAPGCAAVTRLGLTWPEVLPHSPADDVATGDLRDDDPAHPAYAVQAQLHPPLADLAGRPRRPARPRRARRGSRAATTWATRTRPSAPTSRPSWPTHGIDLAGRPGGDGGQRPGVRLLLQPDLGALVLGRAWAARGDRGGGAQHLRRPARLPRPPRRAGPGHDAQGDVRLAVPRHRRHLRPRRARCRTTTGSTSSSTSRPTTAPASTPRCPGAVPTSPHGRAAPAAIRGAL